jgi:hypothetical protein
MMLKLLALTAVQTVQLLPYACSNCSVLLSGGISAIAAGNSSTSASVRAMVGVATLPRIWRDQARCLMWRCAPISRQAGALWADKAPARRTVEVTFSGLEPLVPIAPARRLARWMPCLLGNMEDLDLDLLREQVLQLERLVQQITEVQARQIDRERNVPGADPSAPHTE